MGCTTSVASIQTCPAIHMKEKDACDAADDATKEAEITAAAVRRVDLDQEADHSDVVEVFRDAPEADIAHSDAPIDATADDLSQLLMDLGTYQLSCTDLRGGTLGYPTASSSNIEDWQATAIWPHRNCSIDEIQENTALFSLSSESPAEEPMVCLVPGGGNTLRNGILQLPPHAAIVLDHACCGFTFKDITIQGGIVVCSGASCNVTFSGCTLNCTLIALAGASVSLESTHVSPNSTPDDPVPISLAAEGVAIFLSGAGTVVRMNGGFTHGGLQGITVQNGAHLVATPRRKAEYLAEHGCIMERPCVKGFGFTGIDVSGEGTTVDLSFVGVVAAEDLGAHCCVAVHSKSKVVLSRVVAEKAQVGFEISSGVPASLHRCHTEGCNTAGIRLLNQADAQLTECWVRVSAAGTGVVVQDEGARANISSCIVTPVIDTPDSPETASIVAVDAKAGAVVYISKSFLKGSVLSEESATVTVEEPVEMVDEKSIHSPGLIGSCTRESDEDAVWRALLPPRV